MLKDRDFYGKNPRGAPNARLVGEGVRGVLWRLSTKSARWSVGWGLHLQMCHVKRQFLGKPPPPILRQMCGSIGQVAEVQTKKSGLQMGERYECLLKAPKVPHRRGSSAKSARWGGDREDDDDDDDDDGNGDQGYRAAMKGGRYHYSASI